jgi:cell wall assembly regulator SMI1
MPALLDRLERWLRLHRLEYYDRLRPGIPERELMAFERELGRNLPAGLRALYRWHDGQDSDCALAFQADKMFMPFQDVRAAWAALSQLQRAGEFPESNWWSEAWLPFLDNGNGDHLCVDLDGAFAGQPGQLVSFFHDGECRDVEFPSLEKWAETFVAGVEGGLWEGVGTRFQPLDGWAIRALQARTVPGYPRVHTTGDHKQVVHGW